MPTTRRAAKEHPHLTSDFPMLLHERKLWGDGIRFLAGVDEVGRGPLAGPVVAAAVVFTPWADIPAVDDSKKLSAKARETLAQAVRSTPGVRWALSELAVEDVDRINILEASREAMRRAVRALGVVEFTLIDGLPVPDFPTSSLAIVQGDAKSASVAAASILAKVHRDSIMDRLSEEYPGYGFDMHKGYGTKAHLEALRRLGPCPAHRRTFAPVADLLFQPPSHPSLFATPPPIVDAAMKTRRGG